MTSTQYSISAANRITGKSRTTISKHMESSKLSFTIDDNGNKLIDASELIRVYGDDCQFDREEGSRKNRKRNVAETESKTSNTEIGIQKLLDREIAERDRERNQFQEQIEHLKESLSKAQDGHNRATLLLENHSAGRGDIEKSIERIQQRLERQENSVKEEVQRVKDQAKKQIAQHRRALEEERQKSFWKKLWE